MLLPGCKTGDVRKLSYEGATIKYQSTAGADDKTVRQVMQAYIKEVGVIKNAGPVFVELLAEEWRERCRATVDLRQALGEYCGAKFLVTRPYTRRHKNPDQRFILEVCEAGNCDFRISDDFAPEE
jgi:hypothetical protein